MSKNNIILDNSVTFELYENLMAHDKSMGRFKNVQDEEKRLYTVLSLYWFET